MTAHGPFHSLSDTDQQALTDQLRHGASVLGLNYGHGVRTIARILGRSASTIS